MYDNNYNLRASKQNNSNYIHAKVTISMLKAFFATIKILMKLLGKHFWHILHSRLNAYIQNVLNLIKHIYSVFRERRWIVQGQL